LIAESSVRWHVRNLYTKLGVHNRTGASAKARRLKLIH
jgi:ATP/maltotriose-dependent transcriptional regulator MalT